MIDDIIIISGGQTGVDRAALDMAIKWNIPHGGWCPKGRLAENNTTIPKKYLLKETYTEDFSERTILNIMHSDGTLIIVPENLDKITDGTILTIQTVKKKDKPHFIISLSDSPDFNEFFLWLKENNIKTLNIAGPRESQSPGIYKSSAKLIDRILLYLSQNKEIKNEIPIRAKI